MGGGSSTYDYGFRIYNPNLGKFLSVDPLMKSYPWYTPYQFAGNKPIIAIDIDGLEEYLTQNFTLKNSKGVPFLYKTYWRNIVSTARTDSRPNFVILIGQANYSPVAVADAQFQFYLASDIFLVRNFSNLIQEYTSRVVLATIRMEEVKAPSRNGHKQGLVNSFQAPKVLLDNDEGNTEVELKAKFESVNALDRIDNLASILINDPGAKVTIIGSASKTPTNIDGTAGTTTAENNAELAKQRAEAGKNLLISVLKEKYNKTQEEIDALMTRVEVKTVVAGSETDTEEQAKQNRYVEYKVE